MEALWNLLQAALGTLAGAAGTNGEALLGVAGLTLATKLLVDLAKRRAKWLTGYRTPLCAVGVAIVVSLAAHAAYRQDAWALAVMQGIGAGLAAVGVKVMGNAIRAKTRAAV